MLSNGGSISSSRRREVSTMIFKANIIKGNNTKAIKGSN